MDRTKVYIKMSDCPEVQEQWKADVGDFYFVRDRLCRPTSIVDVYDGQGYALLPRDANYGWLPRQDQIQEMIDGSWVIAFENFHNWYFSRCYPRETYPNDSFTSMEQMWLAFYMYEKHKKIWDGEKWVDKIVDEEKERIKNKVREIRKGLNLKNGQS